MLVILHEHLKKMSIHVPTRVFLKAIDIKLYLQSTTDQTLFSVISVAKIMG